MYGLHNINMLIIHKKFYFSVIFTKIRIRIFRYFIIINQRKTMYFLRIRNTFHVLYKRVKSSQILETTLNAHVQITIYDIIRVLCHINMGIIHIEFMSRNVPNIIN